MAGALILCAAVVLLHGLMLSGVRPAGKTATRAPSWVASVQVRQLALTSAGSAATESPAPAPAAVVRPPAGAVEGRVSPKPPAAAATTASPAPPAPAADGTAIPTVALPPVPSGGAPMSDEPPPVYATRLPAPARLRYDIRRGSAALGTADLSWQTDGARYALRLQAALPGGGQLEQQSQGGFDAAGLAPERLADRRRARGAQAANFRRQEGRVSFSGTRWEYPLVPGMQDRLSWMVQLPAIAAAGALVEQTELALQVVGARGTTSRWRFLVGPREAIAVPLGTVDAVRLVRQPEHLYDLRIEVWLDPARDFWPVRVRQTQVPGGETVEWSLSEEPVAPAGT